MNIKHSSWTPLFVKTCHGGRRRSPAEAGPSLPPSLGGMPEPRSQACKGSRSRWRDRCRPRQSSRAASRATSCVSRQGERDAPHRAKKREPCGQLPRQGSFPEGPRRARAARVEAAPQPEREPGPEGTPFICRSLVFRLYFAGSGLARRIKTARQWTLLFSCQRRRIGDPMPRLRTHCVS